MLTKTEFIDRTHHPSTALAVLESVLLVMIEKSVIEANDVANALEDAADAMAQSRNHDSEYVYRMAKSLRTAKRGAA
ncbi:MAG: hypothetical protein HC900_00705 [Methylacidiphilales bacterium]|nr:hypothetical protein [Candidatus Methylacidiphilales bacterium]